MDKNIPLYGIISYSGNQYTVIFKEEVYPYSTITGSLTGYGNFPYEKYPDIPVVNFTGADKVIESINISRDLRPKEESSNYSGTLQTYLNELIKLDIPIIRIRESFENNYKL
jgi:hypothetical protein